VLPVANDETTNEPGANGQRRDDPAGVPTARDSIMVRVADVDLHFERSPRAAAPVIAGPGVVPHRQRFSESIADRPP
jgi:hypothetical protein